MELENRKKTSLMLTVTHLGPGGVQSLVFPLSIELSKLGYTVFILCYQPIINDFQQTMFDRLNLNGVNILIPKKTLCNFVSRFLYTFNSIKSSKIDLIHIHTPIPNIYISLSCIFLRKKQILTFHSQRLWLKRLDHIKGKFKLKITDPIIIKYVSISRTVKKAMIKNYGINENKIDIIYNGIDVNKFNCKESDLELKKTLLGDTDSFVISHIANIDFDIKKQNKIVELYSKIISAIPNAKIIFVGEGKDLNTLKKLISDKNRIYILGNRTDINKILSFTDILILPSSKEGLPLVILEAMAASTPIIASNVGSIPEILKNNVSGMIFNYPNFNQFYDILIDLYNNPAKRKYIGNNAKKEVQKFSFSNFVKYHCDFYNEILYK